MWQLFQKWTNRFQSKLYPKSYTVEVYLSHPRITNRLITILVSIDAHDKDHARRQLLEEIRVSCGKAVLTEKLKP